MPQPRKPGRKLNRADLATLVGVSLVTIDAYVRRGMPFVQRGSKGKEWQFDSAAVIEWLRQQDVEAALGDVSKLNYDEARRRSMAAQAGLQEYELARIRRTMISVDEVEDLVSDEYGAVRSRLYSIPPRLGPICEGKSADEITRLAREEITDALTELTADGIGGGDDAGEPGDDDG